MSASLHTLLVEIIERYQTAGEPVPQQALVESRPSSEATVSRQLESLCQFDLLEQTEHGYRPTEVAHEFVAMDIRLDDVLVFDIRDG